MTSPQTQQRTSRPSCAGALANSRHCAPPRKVGASPRPWVNAGHDLITPQCHSHIITGLALRGKSSYVLQHVQKQMYSTNENKKQPHQILKICSANGLIFSNFHIDSQS